MALLTVKKVASFLSKGEPGKHLDSGSGADSVRGLHLVVALDLKEANALLEELAQ